LSQQPRPGLKQARSRSRQTASSLSWPPSQPADAELDGGVRVADALNALATALDLQGKPAAAESAYAETLALRRRLLGPAHPDYTFTAFNYAGFSFDQGRWDQAVRLSREIVALRGTALPESHPAVAGALQTLGKCLDQLGDHAGAVTALRESLELRKRHLAVDSWLIASSEGVLGEHYTIIADYARAEALLVGADRKLTAAQGADSPRTLANVRRLVDLGSRNGTYLNGRRLERPAPLHHGDRMRLGERGPVMVVGFEACARL